MPVTLDIFNDDAFGVSSLTNTMNMPPEGEAVPDMLDSMFDEEGITTTSIMIERDGDALTMVPATERGAPADVTTGSKPNLITFSTIHLPTRATVMADEVQGVRAFGSTTEVMAVQDIVNKRVAKMRKRIAATLTFHRVCAATSGRIADADGTRILLDLYQYFGVEQQQVNFNLGVEGTDVRQKVVDAKRKAEDVISSSGVIRGWRGICGRNFYDAFVGHKSVAKAFDRWHDGEFLRGDTRPGFPFGDVEWKEFYGKIGNVNFIDPDAAYLIPVVDELFMTKFAPANYMETVNTVGLPYYAKMRRLDYDVGVELMGQSNPLNICTRPRSIIKLTKTAA